MFITIDIYTVWMSWNGASRDDVGKIVVRDVFDESPYVVWREFYEEIETPEGFEQKMKEIIDFVKENLQYHLYHLLPYLIDSQALFYQIRSVPQSLYHLITNPLALQIAV
jgi:hypothetical protein